MTDYINKILKKKLPPSTQPYDQENKVSLLVPVHMEIDPEAQQIPSTFEQNGVGVADTSHSFQCHKLSSN